jgi:hypothetical protein
MNLTQLERIKSELKRRFYAQNKFSGKTVNIRKHIIDLPRRNTLSKHGSVFRGLRQGMAGYIKKKARGSLTILPSKGYLLISFVDHKMDGRQRF